MYKYKQCLEYTRYLINIFKNQVTYTEVMETCHDPSCSVTELQKRRTLQEQKCAGRKKKDLLSPC